jgi:hypothetical protein
MPDEQGSGQRREWTEEFRVAGSKAVEKIKELIHEGNVRKIVIKKSSGEVIREIPLNQGVAVGGILALVAPVLAALGALVAILAEVRIEVVRTDAPPPDEEPSE